MVIDAIKSLEAAKAKVAELEQQIAEQLFEKLSALPGEFGFESVEEFIAAVRAATGKRPARAVGRKAKAAPVKAGKKKRAKRTTITSEIKDQVKSLTIAGKTGAQIAKEVGISIPSVANIKRELGLVKKR